MCHLHHHRKFPTKVIGCVIWILKSLEAAKIPNESNQKPKTQLSSTERPVCGQESTKRCVLTPTHVEEDQISTVRPVLVDQKEEHEIDFRVPGLSHPVVKEAEHLRVQELVKKDRKSSSSRSTSCRWEAEKCLQPIQQNSKEMIRELVNVELFELCETIPKVQCSHCLLYWNQGIVHCTCGQCLIDSDSKRKFNKLRLDALSIPNYVIKKGPNHGAGLGKTKEQKEYHIAWIAWKWCCKKVDSQGGHFTGIHDRCLRGPVYRESQLALGWWEQQCKEWDELAQEDHTYRLTPEEKKRYQRQWYLTSNKEGKNGPMKLRSDYRAAVSMKNRLHHGSGEQVEEPIHRGGTSLNGIGNGGTHKTFFFNWSEFFLLP